MNTVLVITNSKAMLWNYREPFLSDLNKSYRIKIYCDEEGNHNNVLHKKHHFSSFSTNPLKLVNDILKYIRIIIKEKPDIVYNYTVRNCLINALSTPLLKKRKTVLFIAGMGRFYNQDNILSKLFVTLLKYKSRANNVKTYVLNDRDYHLIDSKNTVLLNSEGIDLKKFIFKSKNDNPAAKGLFLGRIIKEKGIDEIIKVAQIVRSNERKISIDLWGNANEAPVEIIKNIDSADNVFYKGLTNNVSDEIKKCDFLILPSRLNEGFPRIILEAFAIGRRVFVFDNPGCTDAYKKLGLIDEFVSHEETEMANQILTYLSKDSLTKHELSCQLRSYVEDYHDITDITKELLNVFR